MVQASQSWDEQDHPPSSPVTATCSSLHSPARRYCCPLASEFLSLNKLPHFMPVPVAFICHQVLQDPSLVPQLSARVTSFPIACGVPFSSALPPSPSYCHSEMKFKGCSRPCTQQRFSVPVERETRSLGQLAQLPRYCCAWPCVCEDAQGQMSQAPGGVRCPGWDGRD